MMKIGKKGKEDKMIEDKLLFLLENNFPCNY